MDAVLWVVVRCVTRRAHAFEFLDGDLLVVACVVRYDEEEFVDVTQSLCVRRDGVWKRITVSEVRGESACYTALVRRKERYSASAKTSTSTATMTETVRVKNNP